MCQRQPDQTPVSLELAIAIADAVCARADVAYEIILRLIGAFERDGQPLPPELAAAKQDAEQVRGYLAACRSRLALMMRDDLAAAPGVH